MQLQKSHPEILKTALVCVLLFTSAFAADDMKWIDGRELPIEGRAFDGTEHYYDRLPTNVTTSVNSGVRSGKHHTSGMQFRFSTDSSKLVFKWTPYNSSLSMNHMPATERYRRLPVRREGRTLALRQGGPHHERLGRDPFARLDSGDAVSREPSALQRHQNVHARHRAGGVHLAASAARERH